MPDILIRNISDSDLHSLDRQAQKAGLSRADYVRRHLEQQAPRSSSEVTPSDFERLALATKDLGNRGIIESAWS